MVTGERLLSSPALRYRLGTIFIWLGVLTWLPFIFLKVVGERPPFLLFLPFHLIGVVGGSRLRAVARQELGGIIAPKDSLRLIGHMLIFLGILVWVPYFYLKLGMGQPVEVMSFLPYHLSGVLGGVSLHIVGYVRGRMRKARLPM